jgi:hypothetical protein
LRPLTTLTHRAGTRQVLHVQRFLHDDAWQVHGARHQHPLLRRRVRPYEALARPARSKARRLAAPWGRSPLALGPPACLNLRSRHSHAGKRLRRRPGACPQGRRRRRLWPSRWEDFRGSVLGPTDPKDAPEGALRGIIAADWEKLGLKAPCNGGDNAVHASASPFEGLAERTNWLGVAIADDPFGKVLLAAGIPEATIKKWSSDPQVTYDAETAKSTGKTTRSKVPPPLAAPDLGSCASSGRAWWLWAVALPGRGRPIGRLAAALGDARASRLQSRRLHRLLTLQARRRAPSSTPSRTSTTRRASTSASPSARPRECVGARCSCDDGQTCEVR